MIFKLETLFTCHATSLRATPKQTNKKNF